MQNLWVQGSVTGRFNASRQIPQLSTVVPVAAVADVFSIIVVTAAFKQSVGTKGQMMVFLRTKLRRRLRVLFGMMWHDMVCQ